MYIFAWKVNCGCEFVGILVGDWVCCHCVLMSDRPPLSSLWPHRTCSPSQKPLKRQCKRQEEQWRNSGSGVCEILCPQCGATWIVDGADRDYHTSETHPYCLVCDFSLCKPSARATIPEITCTGCGATWIVESCDRKVACRGQGVVRDNSYTLSAPP